MLLVALLVAVATAQESNMTLLIKQSAFDALDRFLIDIGERVDDARAAKEDSSSFVRRAAPRRASRMSIFHKLFLSTGHRRFVSLSEPDEL